MAFTRPTLQQIISRIQGDFTARLGQQSSTLRRSWTSITARATGGQSHLLYGYLSWIARQMFADTAEAEALIQEAAVYGIQQKAAEFADGYARVGGTIGKSIPINSVFLRSDGFRYIVQATTTQTSSFTNYLVRAETAGSTGNLDAAQPLVLESPIDGITSLGEVEAAGIKGGFDQETTEELRARLLLRKRNPPQGGSRSDYKIWALETPGIAEAFVYSPKDIQDSPPIPPFGWTYVYLKTSDPLNPIPSDDLVEEVQDYLDIKKESTAFVLASAIAIRVVNFEMLVNITSGSTEAEALAEITAELKDLFLREGLPKLVLRLSQINEAISSANSENYHNLTLPIADVVLEANEIAVVGTVTLTPF